MTVVNKTPEFEHWLDALSDIRACARILARISNMEDGNLEDWKSVGDAVSESRIDYGPGYRLYFTRRAQQLIVLLCGGDKSTQRRDIARAKKLAANL